MKQIKLSLILVMSMLVFNTAFATDSKSIVSTIVDKSKEVVDSTISSVKSGVKYVDTSSTFHTIYSDMKQGIAGVATALKIGAEHVYKVLVMQQVVYAICYLLCFIFGLILFAFAYKQYNVYDKKWNEFRKAGGGRYDDFFHISVVFCIAGLLLGVIFFVVGCVNIGNIVSGFVNPEYGAIQDIINFVKK